MQSILRSVGHCLDDAMFKTILREQTPTMETVNQTSIIPCDSLLDPRLEASTLSNAERTTCQELCA